MHPQTHLTKNEPNRGTDDRQRAGKSRNTLLGTQNTPPALSPARAASRGTQQSRTTRFGASPAARGSRPGHADSCGLLGRASYRGRVASGSGSRGARTKRGTFSDDLRARSDEQLAALLFARPDLARPPASDIPTLASRATSPASVTRTIDALDSRLLNGLSALIVADGDLKSAAALCAASNAEMKAVADDLWNLALIWRRNTSSQACQISGAVTQALGHVAGLAPATDSPMLADDEVDERLAKASPEARRLLDTLTWGPPMGDLPAAAPAALTEAVDWLTAHDLLERLSPTRVQLPREVALALRGGRIAPGEPLHAPNPRLASIADRAAASALAAASDIIERIDELGHLLGSEPPRMLRANALGVRELRRIATQLDTDRDQAVLLLELAYAAGLVGTAEVGDTRASDELAYAPTVAFDAWRIADPATRWAHLALSWFGTDRAPGLIGDTPPSAVQKGSLPPPAVFGMSASSAVLRAIRHTTLTALATLRDSPGTEEAAVSLDDLVALIAWRLPRRDPAALRDAVGMAVREATALGIASQQPEIALSDTGAALWRAWRDHPAPGGGPLRTEDLPDVPGAENVFAALTALGEALPPSAHELLLQADLTAVVPGRLDGAFADFLRSTAELESRGGAAVFRFTPDSVRRHLDSGATADDLLATLARLAPTGVPQPLDYLVRDVARRHGRLRVGSLATFIVSDDISALDAAEHDPALAGLGLRRLAPTVLAAKAAKRAVVTTLRQAGHSPVAEGAGGAVEPEHPTSVRASDRPRLGYSWAARPHARPAPVTPEDATRAVEALRAGDAHTLAHRDSDHGDCVDSDRRITATDPAVTLEALREAAAGSTPVWLGVVGADGSATRLLFRPTSVEAGRAHGTVDGSDEPRTFSVHRLIGAIPATRG